MQQFEELLKKHGITTFKQMKLENAHYDIYELEDNIFNFIKDSCSMEEINESWKKEAYFVLDSFNSGFIPISWVRKNFQRNENTSNRSVLIVTKLKGSIDNNISESIWKADCAFRKISKEKSQTFESYESLQYLLGKDDYTFFHSIRVRKLSEKLIKCISENDDLLSEDIHDIFFKAAECHDIGKIGCKDENLYWEKYSGKEYYAAPIPPSILHKINRHPFYGIGLLYNSIDYSVDAVFFPILCHHLSKENILFLINEQEKIDKENEDFSFKRKSFQKLVYISVLKVCDSIDAIFHRNKKAQYNIQETLNMVLKDVQNKPKREHYELPLSYSKDTTSVKDGQNIVKVKKEAEIREKIIQWLQDIKCDPSKNDILKILCIGLTKVEKDVVINNMG